MYSRYLQRKAFWMAGVAAVALCNAAAAQDVGSAADTDDDASYADIEEILVTTSPKAYNNSLVTEGMIAQQTPLTSPLALIDNLPGVSIQEGDTFGFDDWSTTISIRGFQVSLDEQQIGITIDGMPNGNSNYGGGAKANRYIDSMNIGGVEVSQGTADIASRSNEALGGTLNFLTDNPEDEQNMRFSVSLGKFDAQRFFVRYDTGQILGDTTTAWISASHQEATDWVNGAAENERTHFAAKFVSDFENVRITGYASYDDTHEDNYQRLFSAADFENNPEWDQLTDEWTGIPYVDQLYRRGWSTLRENFFSYLKAEIEATESINLEFGGYFHKNYGRGDWVPPYIVDVVDDGDGNPHSELAGGPTVQTGASLGRIYFVDASGAQLSPIDGCVSSILFPYGGAGPEADPACHAAGAIPVQSYRHTHYEKDRLGFTADADWTMTFDNGENLLRAGIWYEDATRNEWRDWHKITDTRVGFEFDRPAYWEQYDREYPQDTFKWYIEDTLTFGPLSANVGVKQFLANVARTDLFGETSDVEVDSDSDLLFSAGLLYETPVDGLTVFGGYAENFKSISDLVIERPDSDIDNIEPETARNIDAGLRYANDRISASLTYYDIEFENRLIFLSAESSAGPDFLIGTNGTFFNAGGIESSGFEFSASVILNENFLLYTSYTNNESTYIGTGDPLVDAEVGIVPGNKVVGVAENLFVASLDWQSGPYRAGVSTKFTGDRPVTLDNSWVAESNVITDLYVGVSGEAISDSFKNIDMSLVINNLTDEDFLGGIAGQGAWIGAPRTVVFTLTADF